MPGFVIHIAIAKEYIRKHPKEIKNKEKFINGSIDPDLVSLEKKKDKSLTHYGKWGKHETITNIDMFLDDKNVNINDDYWRGYFLHLLTDHYFYNIIFKEETEKSIENNDYFYNDYDVLNNTLMDKYDIHEIDIIKKYMQIVEEKETKYLKVDKIIDFIDYVSNFNLAKKEKEYKNII